MSAVLSPAASTDPNPWRPALLRLAVLWLAIGLLYGDTLRSMVAIWARSDTFAHAFLVPPIAAWLVWRRRATLRTLTPGTQAWLALPFAAVALLWLLGEAAGANVVAQFAVTALLVLAVPAVLGTVVARTLAFPLLFLFFMVPAGEFMTPRMMEWTADFTVYAVSLSGVPVYREGQQFIIPSGSWSVVEACSGVRYLIASFMVGTLFAYLNFHTWRRRLVFCLVSVLTPIVANWVRAYLIVMIGHTSGNTLAVGADHLVYGWVFFGVVIALMFFIGARWAEPAPAAAAPRPDASGPPAPRGRALALAVLLALVAALPPAAAHRLLAGEPAAPFALQLPALDGVAPAGATGEPPLRPVFEGPTAEASRRYAGEGGDVYVHVAYYRRQGYGRKLVSSENVLVRSKDPTWNRVATGSRELVVDGESLRFAVSELLATADRGDRERLEVRQIYWVGGGWTDNDQIAALRAALARLAGRPDDAAMVTLYTSGATAAVTGPRLDRFTQRSLGTIESHLAVLRAAR